MTEFLLRVETGIFWDHGCWIPACAARPWTATVLNMQCNPCIPLGQINSSPPWTKWPPFRRRCVFVKEKLCILIKVSLKFVPKDPIDNNPALLKVMAWCRIGGIPLSEPMLPRFTHNRERRSIGPLRRESTDHRWIPLQKSSNAKKILCYDVIMWNMPRGIRSSKIFMQCLD